MPSTLRAQVAWRGCVARGLGAAVHSPSAIAIAFFLLGTTPYTSPGHRQRRARGNTAKHTPHSSAKHTTRKVRPTSAKRSTHSYRRAEPACRQKTTVRAWAAQQIMHACSAVAGLPDSAGTHSPSEYNPPTLSQLQDGRTVLRVLAVALGTEAADVDELVRRGANVNAVDPLVSPALATPPSRV